MGPVVALLPIGMASQTTVLVGLLFSRIRKQAEILMECENPVSLPARCLPEDAKFHEILDEPIRRCGSHVQHAADVGSSELWRFVEMLQKLLRPWKFLPQRDQAA